MIRRLLTSFHIWNVRLMWRMDRRGCPWRLVTLCCMASFRMALHRNSCVPLLCQELRSCASQHTMKRNSYLNSRRGSNTKSCLKMESARPTGTTTSRTSTVNWEKLECLSCHKLGLMVPLEIVGRYLQAIVIEATTPRNCGNTKQLSALARKVDRSRSSGSYFSHLMKRLPVR